MQYNQWCFIHLPAAAVFAPTYCRALHTQHLWNIIIHLEWSFSRPHGAELYCFFFGFFLSSVLIGFQKNIYLF